MKALAILTVKNEGAFLLEWLAHHRAVGFDDFLVYSNDCSDGTDRMLDRLAAMGWLTHVRNDGPHPQGPQWAALKAADRHPAKAAADWVLFIDIDEFVNIHAGGRRLPDLLAALPDATAIALTWRMFGNAGVVDFVDQPITAQFTRCAPADLRWPWRASLIKTLFRNDGSYARLGVHRPRQPDPDRIAAQVWYDGAGRRLPAEFHQGRIFTPPGSAPYDLAQLNHYALGSAESYLVKADRGRANRDSSTFDMSYWVDRNFCDIEERSILALDSSALCAELRADPVLGALHRQAVLWRQSRFAALMAEEPWRALFARLLLAPPSRPLSPAALARLMRHAVPSPARSG